MPNTLPPTLRTSSSGSFEGIPLIHPERIPSFRVRRGRYEMYFATTEAEREMALRLRYEVFHLELGEGDPSAVLTGLDRDPFDDQFQHLLVMDIVSGRPVGTYRMQTAEAAREGQGFYTDLEFDLGRLGDDFLARSVELGRACVALEHRNKVVLYLLWQGLILYLGFHHKQSFFGCSSLTSQDMAEGLRLYDQLAFDGHLHPELQTVPRPDWTCAVDDPRGPVVKVPSLFRAYLRQGAKILSPPAIDRSFGTIDYLTYVFVTDSIAKRYALPGA